MSYESEMFIKYRMPSRKEVEQALLCSLVKHGGVIKEFASGQDIVEEIADEFGLNNEQRSAYLETIYRKENRRKKSLLWHRLLFRAAYSLAEEKLISQPSRTLHLTGEKEWMLMEKGVDEALKILNVPSTRKDAIQTKSFELQKIINKLCGMERPENYNPIDNNKLQNKVITNLLLRARGFRLAVIEVYDKKCAVCGLKINSPDLLSWEVEAAHIIPSSSKGRDDIWNGLAMCRLHHWAFDVGWFTLSNSYKVQVSSRIQTLPPAYGTLYSYEFLRSYSGNNKIISLPSQSELFPHISAIEWHRQNVFFK
jgi:hypothetical protein